MFSEPNPISREEFDRLKQLRVDFQAEPFQPVPTHSPQPPQSAVPNQEPRATLGRKTEFPASEWKHALGDVSRGAVYGIPLLGLFQGVTAPKEFHRFLVVTDSFFGAFYQFVYAVHVALFQFIGSLHSLTKLPNLNSLLFCLIIGISIICYFCALQVFFMSGSYLGDYAGRKWSNSIKAWVASLPALLFFGPLLGWLAVHLFVIFILDPVVWLLAPHR